MPVEIEAKIKVDDLAAVRRRLRELGAERAGAVMETNAFFDTDDRALLAADKGLRLRRTRDLETGEEAAVVTYKGPRLAGPLKQREEHEFAADPPAGAAAVFEAMGFAQVLSFEKRRESWTLGGCKVELDELPHLGVYVEIEGPAEQPVQHVRQQLGLANEPVVTASYIGMLTAYLQERGLSPRTVTFPEGKG